MKEHSPMVLPEYVPDGQADAEKYAELADEKFASALVYNQTGNNYSILTVLFALVLFFTAVSQRKLAGWAPWVLLALAFAAGAGATITMLMFPVLIWVARYSPRKQHSGNDSNKTGRKDPPSWCLPAQLFVAT